jgi:hypothetical protein
VAQEPLTPSAKTELLRRLEEGFAAFMEAVSHVYHELEPSEEGWGAFEVLAHVDGWHRFTARRLRQIATGAKPIEPGPEDNMNEAFVAERAGLSGVELVDQVRQSFEELQEAVEAVPEREFWRGQGSEEDSLAYFIAKANGPDHYEEHLPELREGAAGG